MRPVASDAVLFDAVLFDLDGVLVDTEPWWDAVRLEFARAHGRPWGVEDQQAVMGGNSRQWSETMRERLSLDDLDAAAIEAAIVAGVVGRYRTMPVPVIAGAPETVRRIAAGHPVAIASSAHRLVIEAAVETMGLGGVLDAVVSSDDVPAGKPEPDVYLLAARRLGVAPGRCLVVEDSVNGVRAGKAAGMTVALIPNPSTPPSAEAIERADIVLDRITALDAGSPPSTPRGRPHPAGPDEGDARSPC